MRVWPGTGPRTAPAVRSPRMDSLRAAPAARPRVPLQRGCSRSINLGTGLTPAGSSDAPSARTLDHAPQSGQRAASDRPGHSRALPRASSVGTGRCRWAVVESPPRRPLACLHHRLAQAPLKQPVSGTQAMAVIRRSAALCGRPPVSGASAVSRCRAGMRGIPGTVASSPAVPRLIRHRPRATDRRQRHGHAPSRPGGIPGHRRQTSRDRGERRSGPDAGAMRPRGCRSTASERPARAVSPDQGNRRTTRKPRVLFCRVGSSPA